jgi:pyruvate ferredoxin oxidoreductase alpha subunit
MYDLPTRVPIVNYIYGLGGRDSSTKDLRKIFDELARVAKTGKADVIVHYFGLRE